MNCLESVAVDDFMKRKLDKMVVINMENRQAERNQRRMKQTLVLKRKTIVLEY